MNHEFIKHSPMLMWHKYKGTVETAIIFKVIKQYKRPLDM